MSAYYLDTSAAVKLYVAEAGSAWLRHLLVLDPLSVVLSSQLLRVEVWSAFARRWREGAVTQADYIRMCEWFASQQDTLYRLVPVNEAIIQRACGLIERQPLRGYDAVHLATALVVNQHLVEAGEPGLTFLSADVRLNNMSASEGLVVDNPNDHL